MTKLTAGTRVEIANSATGTQTGSGRRGTVVNVATLESSVTGALVRWTSVDVRLDSGSIVTREPKQLRVVAG